MVFRNSFYFVDSSVRGDGSASYVIRLNAEHGIFRAHFPGEPITPGVCILQMGLELLSDAAGEKVELCRAKNVKFLHILHPDDGPVEVRIGQAISAEEIASMDVLVAARMHAVIAALSSGTAVIPTGYSPKFEGLTEKMNYPYLVDLRTLETAAAVRATLQWIDKRTELRLAAQACRPIYTEDLKRAEGYFSKALADIAEHPGEET